jgi:hypothetical protein
MNIRLTILAIFTTVLLTGCFGTTTPLHIERIEVPIPVPCRIVAPVKPVMPLSEMQEETDDIYVLSQKSLAEIERRKGYEKQLEAAIQQCNL